MGLVVGMEWNGFGNTIFKRFRFYPLLVPPKSPLLSLHSHIAPSQLNYASSFDLYLLAPIATLYLFARLMICPSFDPLVNKAALCSSTFFPSSSRSLTFSLRPLHSPPPHAYFVLLQLTKPHLTYLFQLQ